MPTQHIPQKGEQLIPGLNQAGVLPPFIPQVGPTNPAAMAPYQASIMEVATSFMGSRPREEIFEGLLDYRHKIRLAGLTDGFQWLAGSFLEDCEKYRGRPPKDIDIVTFAHRPSKHADQSSWKEFFQLNRNLFDIDGVKKKYFCDAYYVDLQLPPETIVSRARYWFGLLSHQRDTHLWKGILQIPLSDSDHKARQLLPGGIIDAP